MYTVCDLVDELRDAILDYHVSINIKQRTRDGSFMQLVGCPAQGNLQAELTVD